MRTRYWMHLVTYAVCEELPPAYDKPMVFYLLSNLMFAGIAPTMAARHAESSP
jgi:dTDP-glucose pyrophosphorylase